MKTVYYEKLNMTPLFERGIVNSKIRPDFEMKELELIVELREFKKGLELSIMGESVFLEEGDEVGSRGQILGIMKSLSTHLDLFRRIYEVWDKYHLNGTRAGTTKQREIVRNYEKKHNVNLSYKKTCELLKEEGMFEDDGVKYGYQWLFEELPEWVIKEVKSWKNDLEELLDE